MQNKHHMSSHNPLPDYKLISLTFMQQHQNKQVQRNSLLKSFLDATTINTELSDEEQIIIEMTYNCVVCLLDLGNEAPTCKFCRGPACLQHLRKRRRLRDRFEKICDECEDKLLFELLLRNEVKVQEALSVQEQILNLKVEEERETIMMKEYKKKMLKDERKMILENRIRLEPLQKRTNKLLEMIAQIKREEDVLAVAESKVDIQYEASPGPIYKDYEFMQARNKKITKQLLKLQMKINESKKLIGENQIQLSNAYAEWENRIIQQTKEEEQQEVKEKCLTF